MLKIWNFAQQNNFDIITKDSDFNNIASFYNTRPRIIWLRIGNATTKEIANVLLAKKQEIINFIQANEAGILEIHQI
jgi:predicted nuclease of predicted toxin-antitoxin system